MNLNKQQQQLFTQLNNILKAIRSLSQDPAVIKDKMQEWVADFEANVGNDVKVRYANPSASEIVLIDCSRDSLKSSLDAAQVLSVRARSEGILIAVTAAYKDQYAHSNEAMADALEALAKEIRSVPFQIIDRGTCDIHSELGVHHANDDTAGDLPEEHATPAVVEPELPADPEEGVISLVQIPGEADPV